MTYVALKTVLIIIIIIIIIIMTYTPNVIVNVNDKILNIAHITIKDISALQLSRFELQQTISNLKKVSLELSLAGSGSRYAAEIWR
jgi:hypothetical protein